ncbi:MAG: CarD family transcriptional regulator [Oscillospiraceae bacterium]|nr:CarD family transcriptional regulator [Oscillospiraceae bacterium]
MYQVGAYVFYGNTGVCEVVDISQQTTQGSEQAQSYYVLKPLHQECMIYTPVNNTKVFMRPIISREEANRLIDRIPHIHAQPYHNHVLSQLTEHYKEGIRSHDCENLLEMTMSIYAKKRLMQEQKRKFGAVDERFMKQAEDLLFNELSAALGMLREEVPDYIASRVEATRGSYKASVAEA